MCEICSEVEGAYVLDFVLVFSLFISFQIEFVENLPKTVSMKIRRTELREREWGRQRSSGEWHSRFTNQFESCYTNWYAFLVLNHILKNKSLFLKKPEEKHSLSNLTRTLKGQSTFLGILLMDSNCFAIFVQQHSSYVCSDIYYY